MIKEFLNTDKISIPIGRFFSRFPITPNQWSLISVLPAVVGLYCAYADKIILAFIFFILSGLMDGIDGGIARYRGTSTRFGAFLDGSMDRIVDFLIIFSFLFLNLPDFLMPVEYWLVATTFFCLMPTFEVAYANHRGAVPDPTEKEIWRILHRAEMYPLFLLVILLSCFSPQVATYVLVFTTVMSFVTSIQTIVLTYIKSRKYS
jgi:CDP-diacylglycerol--glycerol-3-phosphate 3-phosphatidyltransferase